MNQQLSPKTREAVATLFDMYGTYLVIRAILKSDDPQLADIKRALVKALIP